MKMKKLILILSLLVSFGLFADTVTMTDERDAVSQGKAYVFSDSFSAATRDYRIVTGTVSPRVSISMYAATTDSTKFFATVAITEGCTLSAGASTGTALTAYNINRNLQVTIPAKMTVNHSPGARTGGSALPTFTYAISLPDRVNAFEFDPLSSTSGWILKPRTFYLVTVTPTSAVVPIKVRINIKE
jgi:hypothetical protein